MDKDLTVRCTLCAGGRLRQPSPANSNLKKHSNLKLDAKRPLDSKQTEDDGASKSKQRKLDFSRPEVKMFDPGEVRRLAAVFVVEDAPPISTVESEKSLFYQVTRLKQISNDTVVKV